MAVTPQSSISFYRDTRLTDYDTRLFTVSSERDNFFARRLRYTYGGATYIRDGVCRVGVNAGQLYDVDYCSFVNTGFNNKIYYAFVRRVEYVNENSCDVYMDIDYYMTFMFDFTIGTCFVEREHVSNDTIGANTVAEPINFDNTFLINYDLELFNNWDVIIYYTPNWEDKVSSIGTDGTINYSKGVNGEALGSINQGLYSGANRLVLDFNAGQINDNIDTLLRDGYEILKIVMIPQEFTNNPGGNYTMETNLSKSRPIPYMSRSVNKQYTPKNNKCFTYPYYYAKLSTHNKNEAVIPIYRMYDGDGNFYSEMRICYQFSTANIKAIMAPVAMDGKYNSLTNFASVEIDDFPTCQWSESQISSVMSPSGLVSAVSSLASATSGTIGSVVGLITGAGNGNILSPIQDVINEANKIFLTPPVMKGVSSGGELSASNNSFGFYIYTMGLCGEDMERLDDFFTRFGYRVDKYKVPSTTSRQYFNYVKTVDFVAEGSIPNEAREEIRKRFINGITLWHVDDIGNYNVSNSIR